MKSWDISDPYDFFENTFTQTRRSHTAAGGQREHGGRGARFQLVHESDGRPYALVRGRGPTRPRHRPTGRPPGPWTVISGKSDGITPGFTIRDSAGIIWFIKFDPPSNPEMATGAEMVSTKLFWALGFHVPENHLATLRRDNLEIDAKATIGTFEDNGERSPMATSIGCSCRAPATMMARSG